MAKDKKSKKDKNTVKSKSAKATKGMKAFAQNPLVADVVAAALVATAAALKDSKRARALASDAGNELTKLSKAGSERGNALWDMALEIGRRSVEALTGDGAGKRGKPKSRVKDDAKKKRAKPAKTQ